MRWSCTCFFDEDEEDEEDQSEGDDHEEDDDYQEEDEMLEEDEEENYIPTRRKRKGKQVATTDRRGKIEEDVGSFL